MFRLRLIYHHPRIVDFRPIPSMAQPSRQNHRPPNPFFYEPTQFCFLTSNCATASSCPILDQLLSHPVSTASSSRLPALFRTLTTFDLAFLHVIWDRTILSKQSGIIIQIYLTMQYHWPYVSKGTKQQKHTNCFQPALTLYHRQLSWLSFFLVFFIFKSLRLRKTSTAPFSLVLSSILLHCFSADVQFIT